jgi:predicted nucleic acid-binding protein
MGRIVIDASAAMTPYDAGYVALAEQLGASLVTCDAKFIAPPGIACTIELIR